MPATDYYLIEASIDLLAVSENVNGSTTYILFSVKNGSSVISADQAFPLDYHGVRKSLFFVYRLASGTKLELWVQTDKKRVSRNYLFRIYRLFTA